MIINPENVTNCYDSNYPEEFKLVVAGRVKKRWVTAPDAKFWSKFSRACPWKCLSAETLALIAG
jgi:hypothetical protein